MHPNEIALVWRTPGGKVIPTKEFFSLSAEAATLGPKYNQAFGDQVARQTAAFQPATVPVDTTDGAAA